MSMILSPLLSQPSDCLCSHLQLKLSPARLDMLLNALRSDRKELTELGLQTIDHLIFHHIMPPTTAVLDVFQTTDEGMARIFSDVLEKCKDVRGKTVRPTLKGAWQAQTLAQHRQDMLPPAANAPRLISRRDYPLLSLQGLCARTLVPIPDTPWLLAETDYAPAAKQRSIRRGHICSLIQLPPEETARELLADLLAQQNVRTHIRSIRAVGPADYLGGVLDAKIGCDVDFFALTLATGRSLEELLQHLPEGYLIWTTKRGARRLSERLENIGCTITAFIEAKRRPRLTFYYQREPIFDCSLSSLRNVVSPRAVEVHLAPPSPCSTETATPALLQVGSYIAVYHHLPAEQTMAPEALSDWLVQAQRAITEAGARMDRAYLAVGVCEDDSTPHGGLWSAALSLHRARSEMDIAAFDTRVCPSEGSADGTTVCLIAPFA